MALRVAFRWYQALAAGCMLVKFDARGTGLSDRAVDDFTLQARVSDVAAVVEALNLETVTLLGVFHTGPVVMQYALEHPGRVSKLILADGVLIIDGVSLAADGGALPLPTDGPGLGPADVAALTPGTPLHEVRIGPATFSPEEHPAWESDIRLHYDFEAGTVFATIFADSLVAQAAVQGEGPTTVRFTVESGVLDLITEPVAFAGAPFARTSWPVRSSAPVRFVALKDGQTLTFDAWLVGEVTASFEPDTRQLFISVSLQSADIPDIFGFVSDIEMHGDRLLTNEEHAILQAHQVAD